MIERMCYRVNINYFIHSIVLGPVPPDQLGLVLPHEHLFIDFQKSKVSLPDKTSDIQSIAMNNLRKLRQYP